MAILRHLSFWLGLGLRTACALRFDVTSKHERRASVLALNNQADRRYITTLEIAGTNYTVLVDTGRSVLASIITPDVIVICLLVPICGWRGMLKGLTLGQEAKCNMQRMLLKVCASRSRAQRPILSWPQGPIKTASVWFGNYHIPDQAIRT